MSKVLIMGALLLVIHCHLSAQCTTPAGAPANGSCVATQATNGMSINGTVVSFTGSGGSFSSLSINSGGTLQICGSLTIATLNFNNGKVVIMSGGKLTLGSNSTINSNCSITNYGSLTVNGNLTVQGSATSFLFNASTSATISLGSGTLTLNSSTPTSLTCINLGTITGSTLLLNGSSSLCMGPNTSVQVTNISNSSTNSITVSPAGSKACLKYTGNANCNQSLSATADLTICKGPIASQSGSGGFGSATVQSNCNTCPPGILPLALTNFSIIPTPGGAGYTLTWTTAMEQNLAGFAIEQSQDGKSFHQADFVNAHNAPSNYTWPCPGFHSSYFRLRMQDLDGKFAYSAVVFVKGDPDAGERISVFPNPLPGSQLNVRMLSLLPQSGRLIITEIAGRQVYTTNIQLSEGDNTIPISLPGLAPGIYHIYFKNDKKQIGPMKWVKE